MHIGELARLTGSTPRALRHYEQAGLITSERHRNGYRSYDNGVVVRVRNIRELLAVGLTLDDVRAFLPCLDGDVTAAAPTAEGIRIARDRLAVLDQRVAIQIAARDRLVAALDQVAPVAVGPGPGPGRTPTTTGSQPAGGALPEPGGTAPRQSSGG